MAFWRRIWQRDGEPSLAACTALDVGTEFAKALVFEIDETGHGTVRGVGRKRQGLSHMQSGTVADIAAVVDNCAVALQEAEEMAGFRPEQVVIGIAGELVKGFTTVVDQQRPKADLPITQPELGKLIEGVQRQAMREAERSVTWETGLQSVDVRLVHAAVVGAWIDGYAVTMPAVWSSRTAVRSPLRLPVAGSTTKLSRTPSRMRNFSSEFVSGASSKVALRSLSGRASLKMVQKDCQYCRARGPVVYGRSYFSQSARTRSQISAYLLHRRQIGSALRRKDL